MARIADMLLFAIIITAVVTPVLVRLNCPDMEYLRQYTGVMMLIGYAAYFLRRGLREEMRWKINGEIQ